MAPSDPGKSSFFALVAGMTTTFLLVMWFYSVSYLKLRAPKSPSQSESQVLAALPASKFDVFLKQATPKQLLEQMNDRQAEINTVTNFTERSYLLQQQISLAEHIERSDAPREAKDYATRTLLRSRKSLYGFHALGRIPSQANSDEFKACFEKYLNDTNPDIYRDAHTCRLTYELFEVIGGKLDSAVFTRSLSDTLKLFPGDEEVLGTIRQQFDACVESDIETAKRIGEELLSSAPSKDHPTAELYSYFLNRYYLIKANYSDLYVNRYANGKPGQRELLKQSIQLLEHNDCGRLVANEVNRVANWFESQRDRKPAREIYETMIDRAGSRAGESMGAVLRDLGTSGINRLDQIGQPMSLAGVERLGTPVEEEVFKDRVVMVLFYTPRIDLHNTRYFSKFAQVANRFARNSAPLKAIAVPTAPLSASELEKVSLVETPVVLCNWSDSNEPVLLERFPVTDTPYLLILDHKGVVTSANVPIDEFEQEVGLLLDRR